MTPHHKNVLYRKRHGEYQTFITAEMINTFTSSHSHPDHQGLYQSFQYYCDPCTMIMVSGIIDDFSEEHPTIPSVVPSLLGHNIVQVSFIFIPSINIHKISCGGQHAAVLTSSGEIYSWGRGGFGRLGHGNVEPQRTPRLIEALADTPCRQVRQLWHIFSS